MQIETIAFLQINSFGWTIKRISALKGFVLSSFNKIYSSTLFTISSNVVDNSGVMRFNSRLAKTYRRTWNIPTSIMRLCKLSSFLLCNIAIRKWHLFSWFVYVIFFCLSFPLSSVNKTFLTYASSSPFNISARLTIKG